MLKDKINAVEAQMRAKLDEARATFKHSGDKGSSVENAFREFLHEYLPRRLAVGHGEITDIRGRWSSQTDVVIADENHPFTFTVDQPGLFFIEGVSAVGEVKSILTSSELQNALKNSLSFKRLESSGRTGFVLTNESDDERFDRQPPWFLIAFESQLKLNTIQQSVEAFLKQNSLSSNDIADAIFVLGKGSLVDFGDGKGSLRYVEEGYSLSGWHILESELVLFDLLGWLYSVMPKAIELEPILPKYLFLTDE